MMKQTVLCTGRWTIKISSRFSPLMEHAAVLTVLAHVQVIGCHMVGDDAPEIMQGIAIAMKCNATKAQFDATVGIHPTAAEELVTMRQRARRIQGSGTGRGHEHERMAG